MIIAIDGPAGTGKTTLAKNLAQALGFSYFETGAMYRAYTWFILKEGIDIDDHDALTKGFDRFKYTIKTENGSNTYFVNGYDVTSEVRSDQVTHLVSKIAALGAVRSHLVPIQKAFGNSHNAVFEGRDMGSVVFPHAKLKIFLTASASVRAKRRFDELQKKGDKTPFEEVLKDINARDHTDETRAHSPLKKADDAILVDTSNLSINAVLSQLLSLSKKALKEHKSLFYRACSSFSHLLARLFYKHTAYGQQNVPRGKAIIAANHASFIDPPIISFSTSYPVHFFARSTLFEGKIFGSVIKKLNTHPIEYGDHELTAIKRACKLLNEDKKIVLFPEGERSIDGELKTFQQGAVRIAARTHAPVIPTYIEGSFNAWPRVRKWPKFCGKTSCTFGSPLYWENYSHLPKKEGLEKFNHDLKSAIEALAKERVRS